MDPYQVSWRRICPGTDETEYVAFVLADSFAEAQEKVEQRHEKEQERVEVLVIALIPNAEIIV